MGTYLHLFKTQNDFESVYGDEERYIEPWTSLIKENGNITFNKPIIPPHDYSQDYLTFKIQSDGDIIWKSFWNSLVFTTTISYSKDSGKTWTEITATDEGANISVISGDTVLFKGNNSTYCIHNEETYEDYYTFFSGTSCQFEVEGNIMSLIYGDDFIGKTTFPENTSNNFSCFFSIL